LWRRVPDRGLLVADFVFNGYQGRDILQKKEPGAAGGWVFVSGGRAGASARVPISPTQLSARTTRIC
ncbi:MAG: hypothetical protein NZ935_06075, partial [Planctomycetes bacterium]|nr:hypothetical protein [Planctomycetota bacterium]